jgi:hypothetical protein
MKMDDAGAAPSGYLEAPVPDVRPVQRRLPGWLIAAVGVVLVGTIVVVGLFLIRGAAGGQAGSAGIAVNGTATSEEGSAGTVTNDLPSVEEGEYQSDYPVSNQQRRKPDYQRISGDITAAYSYVAMEYAEISPANFVAEAAFVNPSDEEWSYGFGFREHVFNNQCRLYVTSYRVWYLDQVTPELKQPLTRGTILSLDTSSGAVNTLTLVANGANGEFFINGELIGKLDLSACAAGDAIWVGSNFMEEYAAGKVTTFQNFLIWELP